MTDETSIVKLGIPKGRMFDGVISLLGEAGIKLRTGGRALRPSISEEGFSVKILKPQNIIKMLSIGSRDVGFAGADWVNELKADVIELLDTKMDPVSIVAAAPVDLLEDGKLPNQSLVIASEYKELTSDWIARCKLSATFLRSYGATEVFPPEDADCIVDNTATGETLRANNLEIVETLMNSSTRLFANPAVMDIPEKRDRIEHLVLLLRSVLEARHRVMLEVNVSRDKLDALIEVLPSMRKPTVAPLHSEDGFSIRAAVPRSELTGLIPKLKQQGGSDIVITRIAQITS